MSQRRQRQIETMDDWRQYQREKQSVYNQRKREAGYQRATVWVHKTILDALRQQAKTEGTTLENVIVKKLSK